jgi:hypothetical protein
VKELLPLTPEQLARARRRLLHPAPGSRIEAARQYGIDLTLLLGQLSLSPADRVRKMHDACAAAEQVHGAARRIGK